MNDQVGIQVNNNERRFRNPFNLDPDKQDICIEKKIRQRYILSYIIISL